jgi:hypothetical protein
MTIGLSIDIGIRNLAFYVEEFDANALAKLKLPKEKYLNDGTPTENFKKILHEVFVNGKVLYFDVHDCVDGKHNIFLNISDYVDSHRNIFDLVDFIVIEEQLKQNPMAVRVCQHLYSYFLFIFRDFRPIILQSSTMKTRVLGCERKRKREKRSKRYSEIKRWSCETAMNILVERKDLQSIVKFHEYPKQDDIADSMLQLQACKMKCFLNEKRKEKRNEKWK